MTSFFSTSFRSRVLQPELMDDPALDPAEHENALRGLARLNWMGGAASILWPEIARELDQAGVGGKVSLADVATGSGDLPRALWKKSGGRLEILGLDISPVAAERARELSPPEIRFQAMDCLAEPLPEADIVVCSLFFHHLTDDQAADLLAKMRQAARRLVLVSDLERGWLSYAGVWLAARALTRSRVVHVDSGLSIRAAWTRQEMLSLADRAGCPGARVERRFPFRLLLAHRI
jgi:2-polyprenyl-3-methyl-5-hydroxy-6-metoxy-1,4-benzoquinol methylase